MDINQHGFANAGWVLDDKDVKAYLIRELADPLDPKVAARTDDQLKLPVALIALTIAYVAKKSSAQRDGHILGVTRFVACLTGLSLICLVSVLTWAGRDQSRPTHSRG